MELFLIVIFSSALAKKNEKLAYCFHCFLSFVILLQQAVLYYSGGFVSPLMIENINVYKALGSSQYTYFASLLAALFISLIPAKARWTSGKILVGSLSAFVFVSIVTFSVTRNFYSPGLSLALTGAKYIRSSLELRLTRSSSDDPDELLKSFHKTALVRSVASLTPPLNHSRPNNVIVIFSEGMSSEVIDRFNDYGRGLTPNLDHLYENSIVFSNYYNHSAATFRALRGQLFSSHQYLGGYEGNGKGFGQTEKSATEKLLSSKLISITDVLSKNGYTTAFLNSQPSNIHFTSYLENLHFNRIYSPEHSDRFATDRELFEFLWNTVHKIERPFFVGIYNIGTHHGFDSPDAKYGDGNNPILNKFHNFDAQFGKFFERFAASGLSDNTILIFTSDHATFNSPEYVKTFGSNQRYFVNTIPLFIYWKGIKHAVLDVDGRNSLCLAPTILDLLNIDHENYFLGSSLFQKNDFALERITAIGFDFYHTGSNSVIKAGKEHEKEISQIKDFYKISVNME
jgi:hypothetical protein